MSPDTNAAPVELRAAQELQAAVDAASRLYEALGDERITRDAVIILRAVSDMLAAAAAKRQAEELLRETEERFRLLVDQTIDYAIFTLDRGGRIASWNAGAERLKGYRAEEIIGQHVSVLYPPADRGKVAGKLAAASMLRSYREEGWRMRKDGSLFWADVTITPLHDPDGRLRGFGKVTRDVSDRRRLEEELRAAVRARDDFLAIAAHELRTPLASLVLQLERLADARAALPPSAASQLASIERSVARLERLIADLLETSATSIDALVLAREPIDLRAVAEEVTARFADEAGRLGSPIRLSVEGDATGEWDRSRVESMISNLLAHALDAGEGQPVDVLLRGRPDAVSVAVRDHGGGLAPDDVGRVFDRFRRVHPLEHHRGGLGLGLWLTRRFAEALGGSVRVDSEDGRGTTFTVELPRRPELPGSPPR